MVVLMVTTYIQLRGHMLPTSDYRTRLLVSLKKKVSVRYICMYAVCLPKQDRVEGKTGICTSFSISSPPFFLLPFLHLSLSIFIL